MEAVTGHPSPAERTGRLLYSTLILWANKELKPSPDYRWTLRHVTDGMPLMPQGIGEEATFSTPGRSDSFKKANIWQLPFDLIVNKKKNSEQEKINMHWIIPSFILIKPVWLVFLKSIKNLILQTHQLRSFCILPHRLSTVNFCLEKQYPGGFHS